MKVSIITVVYNSSDTISQCIQSVIKQDYENLEYIIIDGNSSDGTVDVIRNYTEHIDSFISEEDNGIYHAMNKGIALANGDIIGILNADDFYPFGDIISKVVDVFIRDRCDSVYGDLVYINKTDIKKIIRYWKGGEKRSFVTGWHPPHPAFFVKKQIYSLYGYFKEDLYLSADFELMLRFIEKYQIKISYVNEILVHMRMGGVTTGSLSNILRGTSQIKKSFDLNQLPYPWYYPCNRYLHKIKQYLSNPSMPSNTQKD